MSDKVSMDEFLSGDSKEEVLPEPPEPKTSETTDNLDVDLTNINTQTNKETKSKTPLTKEEKKERNKLVGSIKDIFKRGIIGKLEMGIAGISPDYPLTESEKDALSLDLDLLMTSPDLIDKLTKVPLWLGIAMLIITLIFMVLSRLMPFFQKKEPEDTSVKSNVADKPEISMPVVKKTTKKKKGVKGSSVK